MSKLSIRLKEYLEERDLTQSALAKTLDIQRSNVSEFLSDKHTPSFDCFVKMLYFFNCSADYLLGLTELHTEETLHPVPAFKDRLRAMLNERGVTQAELIANLPVSSAVPYKWLTGINEPSIESLIRLAEYFDCSVDYLIGRIK